MEIRRADRSDLTALALLIWRFAPPGEQDGQTLGAFERDLATWWAAHDASHRAFLAVQATGEAVGMAWVALVPRVARPGVTDRLSADVQSVFVLPEHRGHGIGAALVAEATGHAFGAGASRVTVQSGSKSVPVYERLGFASSRELLQKRP